MQTGRCAPRGDRVDQGGYAVGALGFGAGGITEPRQVQGIDLVPPGQVVQDRLPRLAPVAQPVQEHEGVAPAVPLVNDVSVVHKETVYPR